MKLKKKQWRKLSCGLIAGSVLAVSAAAWGFAQADVWLASTQWLLVAVVLGILGIYARLES